MSDPTRAGARVFMYSYRFDSDLSCEHKNPDRPQIGMKKPPRLIGGFSRKWNTAFFLGFRDFILQHCKDATIRADEKSF
jgi:hypothetical protein